MTGKGKAPQGRAERLNNQRRKVRAEQSQPQYNHTAINPKAFDVDAHIRAARRAMGEAVVMLSGWPACIRYSYFVGSNGRLLVRGERRGAK